MTIHFSHNQLRWFMYLALGFNCSILLSVQKSVSYILWSVDTGRIWVLVPCGPVQVQHSSHWMKAEVVAAVLGCLLMSLSCASQQSHLLDRTVCCLEILLGWICVFRTCSTKQMHLLQTLHTRAPHAETGLVWDVVRFGAGSWKNCHCFQNVANGPWSWFDR